MSSVVNFIKKKNIESFKLALLIFCAFFLASGPAYLYYVENLNNKVILFTLCAFFNYSAILLYVDIITKRFGIGRWGLTLLKGCLAGVLGAIFLAVVECFMGQSGSFYSFDGPTPDNYFLQSVVESIRPTETTRLISLSGTALTLIANLYLLLQFSRIKLVGIDRLIMAGVAVSFIAKFNDFLMTSGVGYYLIPLGFLSYFFEIVYFQFNLVTGEDQTSQTSPV